MGKSLALFIDGTGNSGTRDKHLEKESNVYRLFELCQESCKLYLEGVGSSRLDILGGVAGFGTKERLKHAYRFLIDNYRVGDNIFLFGFSRGAFAVRLFAGFLGYVGTIFGKPEFEDYLPHAYQIYESSIVLHVEHSFRDNVRRFGENIPPLPIHFIGVWDTVERYFPRRDLPEIETLPSHVDHARHALALHERRREMEPTLWKKWPKSSTVVQRWFPGAHSDVGGSYPESRLSEAPLQWIHLEASSFGLQLTPAASSGQNRILHQQRTIGPVLKILEGEDTREALSAKEPHIILAMEFDQTACDSLLDPITSIVFGNYPNNLNQADLQDKLGKVNERAFQLLLKIASKNDMSLTLGGLTYSDALQSRGAIEYFLSSLSGVPKDRISTCLSAFVLLRGEMQFISDAIESMPASRLGYVKDALEDTIWKLETIHYSAPPELLAAVSRIDQRRDSGRV
jgi:hypothetical protein